jgi:N-methylhydantoinase A/oxoprolinase/acetone carboxylase beta subunit
LALSTRIEGPAIIEQPTTTILVTDGAVATIDEFGNFHIDLVSATQAL